MRQEHTIFENHVYPFQNRSTTTTILELDRIKDYTIVALSQTLSDKDNQKLTGGLGKNQSIDGIHKLSVIPMPTKAL
jgi:hypothetical protein